MQHSPIPQKDKGQALNGLFDMGLVLEGGGYRGQFTAGVLDVFMEWGLEFSEVVGASAGALNGVNYLAHMIGRSNRINLAYRDDRRYMAMLNMIKEGAMVSPEFLYKEIQKNIDPFDCECFNASHMNLHVVVSNVETGRAEYPHIKSMPQDQEWVRASATLPVISKMVEINDQFYLDGGMCDPVALNFHLNKGIQKNVVVLTQHRDYVKSPYEYFVVAEKRYANYPAFLERLRHRHTFYMEQRQQIWQAEQNGTAFIIEPTSPVDLSLREKSGDKLLNLYLQGRKRAYELLPQLINYITQ